ncbi:MAG TPA: hypothetical protein VGF45_03235 [Polyangia bacterium]
MFQRVVAVGLAVVCAGCSTTTVIKHRRGVIEGHVVANNHEAITVDSLLGETSIPRQSITEIDHPGNGHAVAGALLLMYGIANIAVGSSKCESEGAGFCVGVYLPAAAGAGMLAWGLHTWNQAKKATKDPGASVHMGLAPWMDLNPTGGRSGGLALTIRR